MPVSLTTPQQVVVEQTTSCMVFQIQKLLEHILATTQQVVEQTTSMIVFQVQILLGYILITPQQMVR